VIAALVVSTFAGCGNSTKAVSAQEAVRELKEENKQHSEEQNTKAEELKEE
jgi:outer membrane murein-binding lipoprotein Lpp